MSDDADLLWISSYGSHTDPPAHPGTLTVRDATRLVESAQPVVSAQLDPAPSYGAFAADARRLYLAAEGIPGRLLTVDPAAFLAGAGAAAVLDDQFSGGAEACHLQVSPGGRRLAVANYCQAARPDDGGVLAIFTLDSDGIPASPRLLALTGSGPDPERQPGPHAHQVTWLADDLLLLCDLGTDSLITVAVDPADGTPTELCRSATVPGAGPRHLAVLPSGWLVVDEELVGQVSLWEPDGDGRYAQRARAATAEGFPSAIRVSGGGRFAHVAVRGSNVVSTFAIEIGGSAGGSESALRPLGSVSTGGDWPRDLLVDGETLWVANQGSSTVTRLALDPATGVPGEPVVAFEAPFPNWLSRGPAEAPAVTQVA